MEGEKEMVRDTTEGSGEQQAITWRENTLGQKDPKWQVHFKFGQIF